MTIYYISTAKSVGDKPALDYWFTRLTDARRFVVKLKNIYPDLYSGRHAKRLVVITLTTRLCLSPAMTICPVGSRFRPRQDDKIVVCRYDDETRVSLDANPEDWRYAEKVTTELSWFKILRPYPR